MKIINHLNFKKYFLFKMETTERIIRDSKLITEISEFDLEDEETLDFLVDYLKEISDINLLILFYEGETEFTEEEYFNLVNFLDYLNSVRLNECIILAKHLRPDFYKNKEYRELIRYCREFEIEETLFLSFCRYDVLERIKQYMTEENKNSGYNFSLMINSKFMV